MKTKILSFCVALTLLLPTISQAHPGHGTSNGHDLRHYLTSPMYVFGIFALVVVVVSISIYYRKKSIK